MNFDMTTYSLNITVRLRLNLDRPFSPKTDHLMLYATLPPRPPTPQSPIQTIRYNLKYLDNPIISDRLCHSFDTLWKTQQSLFTTLATHTLHSTDPQPLIDTYYDIYTTLIKSCCETTMGTYVLQDKKQEIDKSIPFLSSTLAQEHAVRLFKRSQRGARKPMLSDTPR